MFLTFEKMGNVAMSILSPPQSRALHTLLLRGRGNSYFSSLTLNLTNHVCSLNHKKKWRSSDQKGKDETNVSGSSLIYMKLVTNAEIENRENRVTFKCEYRTSAY